MKITNKRYEIKNIKDISEGDTFVTHYGDEVSNVYMKVQTKRLVEDDEYINAVNLSTGEIKYFELYRHVIPVEAELIVR